jgi:branched-chain amino acid transport system permease protein
MLISVNSFNVIYGFTGYLPFGFAAFIAIGAYTAGMTVNILHFTLIPAILSGGLASLLLSLLLIPLLKLKGAYFAIASLAVFEALYYIYQNPALTGITGGPYGLFIHINYKPNIYYLIIVIMSIISSLVLLLLKKTNFGLALTAINDDNFSAGLSGINILKFRVYAWTLSTFMAGIAGAVFGIYIGFFYPSGVFDLTQFSVLIILFLMFGGKGSYLGPLIGTVILYILYQYLISSFPSYYLLVFGIIIIFVVLFLPNGVIYEINKKVREVF